MLATGMACVPYKVHYAGYMLYNFQEKNVYSEIIPQFPNPEDLNTWHLVYCEKLMEGEEYLNKY